MKLHEYQAKLLFAREGIPIPKSGLANSPIEARQMAAEIGYPVVLKAQVLSGGRGKAGGIRLVRSEAEIETTANLILNSQIRGIPVQRLLVEKAVDFSREFYLGIVNDRTLAKPNLILSSTGGIEIEEVALTSPDNIEKAAINPLFRVCRIIQSARWPPGLELTPHSGKRCSRLLPRFGSCLTAWMPPWLKSIRWWLHRKER